MNSTKDNPLNRTVTDWVSYIEAHIDDSLFLALARGQMIDVQRESYPVCEGVRLLTELSLRDGKWPWAVAVSVVPHQAETLLSFLQGVTGLTVKRVELELNRRHQKRAEYHEKVGFWHTKPLTQAETDQAARELLEEQLECETDYPAAEVEHCDVSGVLVPQVEIDRGKTRSATLEARLNQLELASEELAEDVKNLTDIQLEMQKELKVVPHRHTVSGDIVFPEDLNEEQTDGEG